MKTISIGKHSLRRTSRARATFINCSEAHASYSPDHGYRFIGFDRDGRRWSVTIDERLVADLGAIHARREAKP